MQQSARSRCIVYLQNSLRQYLREYNNASTPGHRSAVFLPYVCTNRTSCVTVLPCVFAAFLLLLLQEWIETPLRNEQIFLQGTDSIGRALAIVQVACHVSDKKALKNMKLFTCYVMNAMVGGLIEQLLGLGCYWLGLRRCSSVHWLPAGAAGAEAIGSGTCTAQQWTLTSCTNAVVGHQHSKCLFVLRLLQQLRARDLLPH